MILLALVPPLWRRVMDQRTLAHVDGDLDRVNATTQVRERLRAGSGDTAAIGVAERAIVPVKAQASSDLSARWTCPACAYVFDEARGDLREGFPRGTRWSEVPADWCCPDCGVREKTDFTAV
jgi:alkane 1-monooxygenase